MIIRDLTIDECRKVLAQMRLGKLSCARENQPYTVPFHFAFDNQNCLYAFSTFGQKIEWMRANPQVCVEVDDNLEQDDWTTLVIFGLYEELPDNMEFAAEREYAHNLLSEYPMWWQPAYVAGIHRTPSESSKPIYFRIRITQMTGHRAFVESSEESRKMMGEITQRSWWQNFWREKK